jgi:diguanylate cyclase (GGDEF)-like protein
MALLFLDFDHFKTINDALGHTAGDRLLVATADRLRTAIRPGDLVARTMGDEFVVLLAAPVERLEAFAVAERIRELVALPVETDGHGINRTVSIGVALGNVASERGEGLLVQADTALHSAKTRGRNQIVFFDDDLREVMHERYDMERLLSSAIQDGRLELHYQPELDLQTGRLLGLEALMRWRHPTRGLLPAGAFIEVAEESGFIVELGGWVVEEAIRQAAIWVREYPSLDVMMRVNLSPVQLMSPGLVGVVSECLSRHRLPGARLCFEITEHAVMQDIEAALQILHELAALGVEFAIDDFGIGHSSMAQLKRLPVATLKIDQSFVAGLPHDQGDRAIVDSIVHLGMAFHVELVAEGVETHEQVQELLALGCHRAQGHLFHEALPVAGIVPLLDREQSLTLSSALA